MIKIIINCDLNYWSYKTGADPQDKKNLALTPHNNLNFKF